MEAHIKEKPVYFHRFDAVWTPTVLILDPDGKEQVRIEGYLPNDEFRARLENGLGRVAFMHKRWEEAERKYGEVAEHYPQTLAAAEAVYWRGVSHYKRTNDHTVLSEVAEELGRRYKGSEWEHKASVWAH